MDLNYVKGRETSIFGQFSPFYTQRNGNPIIINMNWYTRLLKRENAYTACYGSTMDWMTIYDFEHEFLRDVKEIYLYYNS